MPTTKKLLVTFDMETKKPRSSDFLIPWKNKDTPALLGLKSGKYATYGLLVYIGVAITENDLFAKLVDLFAKLVDSGGRISSVDDTLASLRNYIEQLHALKIGNIVRIVPTTDGTPFGLELVAKTASGINSPQ